MKNLYVRYKERVGLYMLRLVIHFEDKSAFRFSSNYELPFHNSRGVFKIVIDKYLMTKDPSTYSGYCVRVVDQNNYLHRVIEDFIISFELYNIYNPSPENISSLKVEITGRYTTVREKPKLKDLLALIEVLEEKK